MRSSQAKIGVTAENDGFSLPQDGADQDQFNRYGGVGLSKKSASRMNLGEDTQKDQSQLPQSQGGAALSKSRASQSIRGSQAKLVSLKDM